MASTLPGDPPSSATEGWLREKQSAHLYRVLAEVEPSDVRRALFARLAEEAEGQAGIWAEEARKKGAPVPAEYKPNARTRFVGQVVRRFGPRRTRGILAAMKVRGMSVYAEGTPGHDMPTTVEEVGRRHRGVAGGNLRAAVFGVNDGLVSNTSLILGVAGAAAGNEVILLSGAAGLLAGAFSMAAGEYVSVRSQHEMFEHQIAAEREELARYPAEEAAELALIYAARGLAKDDAERMAQQIVADPKHALDTLAREELGLDPDQLGSPVKAAGFSFVSFAAGGLVPLLPFVFMRGAAALPMALALAGASLFGVGAAISLFTGREALGSGLRMLVLGGAAGGATYLIGRVLGVSLG